MDADLRDLLAAWMGDEEIDGERRAALLARLQSDDSFRAAFVAEIRLLGMLKVVQSSEPRWLRLEDEVGWSGKERITAEALADRVVQSVSVRPRLWRPRGWALAAAAAVLLILGGIALFRPGAAPDGQTGPAPEPPQELATVVKLEGVQWNEGEGLKPDEGGVVTAGRLRLRSGRLTLAFFTGVALTVEGPADLELRTVDRVFCHEGKLRARVPSGAQGFTVLAPGCEVVDLGTEFGLNVEPGQAANLMVFKGEAALSLVGTDGRSVRSALVERAKAVEIDPRTARIQEVAPEADRFVPVPEVRPQILELAATYPADVLRAKPWGYWRFEQLVEGQVPNEIVGRPGLRVLGGVRLDGPEGGNHWALFQADHSTQALLMDSDWSPPRAAGYAIEFWVQSDALGQNALVSLIDRREGPEENHVALLELTARSQRSPFEPCAVRFLDRWPPGQSGGVNVFSRRNFIPALWHHVVGQKAGDTQELFIDGSLVASSPALPADPADAVLTTPCRLLVGRLKQKPLVPNGQVRPFEGRIDELAVYERPLTAEEIRQHAKGRIPPREVAKELVDR